MHYTIYVAYSNEHDCISEVVVLNVYDANEPFWRYSIECLLFSGSKWMHPAFVPVENITH
jgi:hypothetical protein